MRKIKPSTFVILGFVWPFIGTFIMMGFAMAFPHTSGELILPIVLFLMEFPPVWLFVFGLMLSRAKKDDYTKRNVFKYITPSQVCLLASTVIIFLAMLFDTIGLEEFSDILMIPWLFLMAATVILFIIRVVKNSKMKKKARTGSPYAPMPRSQICSRCGASLPTDQSQIKRTNGQRVCDACMQQILNSKAETEKALHTKCCVCGVDHPKSEMFLVDDNFFCQDCFREKYTGVFYPEE